MCGCMYVCMYVYLRCAFYYARDIAYETGPNMKSILFALNLLVQFLWRAELRVTPAQQQQAHKYARIYEYYCTYVDMYLQPEPFIVTAAKQANRKQYVATICQMLLHIKLVKRGTTRRMSNRNSRVSAGT